MPDTSFLDDEKSRDCFDAIALSHPEEKNTPGKQADQMFKISYPTYFVQLCVSLPICSYLSASLHYYQM